MTGFTDAEYHLARLVEFSVRKGVAESTFGLGGMRSVGPCVKLSGVDGGFAYCINGERGIVLGRTFKEARNTVRRIYHAAIPSTTEV